MRVFYGLLLSATIAAAATTNYIDGDFSTGWTTTKTFDDGGGGGVTTPAVIATGGNPDAYREMLLTYSTLGQQLNGSSIWSGATYDPATEGALAIVSFAWDQFVTGQTGSAYLQIRPLLEQGGHFFQVATNNTPGANWAAYSSGNLGQNNFCRIDATCGSGAVRPDFSALGAPITFGYLVLGADFGQSLPFSQTANVDNFGVTATSSVPEPGTVLLLPSACAGLLWLRRRRR